MKNYEKKTLNDNTHLISLVNKSGIAGLNPSFSYPSTAIAQCHPTTRSRSCKIHPLLAATGQGSSLPSVLGPLPGSRFERIWSSCAGVTLGVGALSRSFTGTSSYQVFDLR